METAFSKQCFSPKYSIFLIVILLTILLLIVMSWMRGEQYTSLFYYIIIKNMHTCISQVFIIMPMEVKKIILPFIFLPSLLSQPEWQLSRIGEEKERKKYTQEEGTVQVLSKTIIMSIAWLTEHDVKVTGYLQPSSLVDSSMKSRLLYLLYENRQDK